MTGSVSLGALAVILAIGSFATAQPQSSNPAMPIEPITAIVQQFKSDPVVALGTTKGASKGASSA